MAVNLLAPGGAPTGKLSASRATACLRPGHGPGSQAHGPPPGPGHQAIGVTLPKGQHRHARLQNPGAEEARHLHPNGYRRQGADDHRVTATGRSDVGPMPSANFALARRPHREVRLSGNRSSFRLRFAVIDRSG